MGYRNREVELKLLVDGHSTMASVERAIRPLLSELTDQQARPVVVGCAADTYWAAPDESPADFIRLRILDEEDARGNPAQITLKSSDKGSNINRIEVDLGVSDHSQANKLLTLMLGDPLGQVTKRYTVFFLEDIHTTVSVYKVMKDKRIFVEVEATTLKRVKEITKILMDQGGLKFTRIPQSLFEMFVVKTPMTPEVIQF